MLQQARQIGERVSRAEFHALELGAAEIAEGGDGEHLAIDVTRRGHRIAEDRGIDVLDEPGNRQIAALVIVPFQRGIEVVRMDRLQERVARDPETGEIRIDIGPGQFQPRRDLGQRRTPQRAGIGEASNHLFRQPEVDIGRGQPVIVGVTEGDRAVGGRRARIEQVTRRGGLRFHIAQAYIPEHRHAAEIGVEVDPQISGKRRLGDAEAFVLDLVVARARYRIDGADVEQVEVFRDARDVAPGGRSEGHRQVAAKALQDVRIACRGQTAAKESGGRRSVGIGGVGRIERHRPHIDRPHRIAHPLTGDGRDGTAFIGVLIARPFEAALGPAEARLERLEEVGVGFPGRIEADRIVGVLGISGVALELAVAIAVIAEIAGVEHHQLILGYHRGHPVGRRREGVLVEGDVGDLVVAELEVDDVVEVLRIEYRRGAALLLNAGAELSEVERGGSPARSGALGIEGEAGRHVPGRLGRELLRFARNLVNRGCGAHAGGEGRQPPARQDIDVTEPGRGAQLFEGCARAARKNARPRDVGDDIHIRPGQTFVQIGQHRIEANVEIGCRLPLQRAVERLAGIVAHAFRHAEGSGDVVDIIGIAQPVAIGVVEGIAIGIGPRAATSGIGNVGKLEEVVIGRRLVSAQTGWRIDIAGLAGPDSGCVDHLVAPIDIGVAGDFLVADIDDDAEIAERSVLELLLHEQVGVLSAEVADLGELGCAGEVDDEVALAIERRTGLEVDRPTQGALDLIGAECLEDFNPGEKLSRQILEIDAAIIAVAQIDVPGARRNRAVDGDVVFGKTAHLHLPPFPVIATVDLHTGDTLERFGDVVVGELADILRIEDILDLGRIALVVDRAFD